MSRVARARVVDPRTRVVTFDVFDTVLLRNTKPERWRFLEAAREVSGELRRHDIAVSSKEIFHARVLCHHIAYRVAPMNRYQREGSFRDVCALMARALGIESADGARLIEEAELRYEAENLRPNHKLIELLTAARQQGKRVFFLSDMYLSEAQIRFLLQRKAPALEFDGGYASSEFSLSKHAGGLFDVFCEREGIAPHELVHIGDNAHSDVAVPRSKGWSAVHVPRSRGFDLIRAARTRYAAWRLAGIQP